MPSPNNILVVEDEPLIAMMLEDFLDILGHRVAGSADNVEGALALVADGGAIDAAIVDVNLRGGETCWPVADALAERGVPFVVATGGDSGSLAPAHRDRPILQKPYTIDGVERALAQLVA